MKKYNLYKDNWYKLDNQIDLSIPISERVNTYSEIKKVVSILNSINSCNYFFSCGTALGIIREGKLLDWDTDVDIDIIEPSEELIELLIKKMRDLNYSFHRLLKKGNNYIQVVFVKAPYHSIDFCFWYKENNGLINDVPETFFYKRYHPRLLYKHFQYINIEDVIFKIPKDFNAYFSHLYGINWRKPKKYSNWFSNARDLKFDLNIIRIFFKILWKASHIINSKLNC